jgi:hypothetical protein
LYINVNVLTFGARVIQTNKSALPKKTAAPTLILTVGADAAASSETAPEVQKVELVESDEEGSIGTDNSSCDMDTRAFMEEYDNKNDGAYDAVFKKIGGFVCGSTCVDDDSQIVHEEVSIASPPRKKLRDFGSDTLAPTAATKKEWESTKIKEAKKVRYSGIIMLYLLSFNLSHNVSFTPVAAELGLE